MCLLLRIIYLTNIVGINTFSPYFLNDKYTSDGEKAEKTKDWLKILLLSTNQKTALLYKVEL
jgi:hypothetical protein